METTVNNTNNTSTKNPNIKFAIIGDQAVGKSSILMQFVEQRFSLTMMGTAGVDCKKKTIDYNNTKIDLHFYDSAGHDRFRHLITQYLQKCKGVILVYDVTDYNSFRNVNSWIDSIKENTDNKIEYIILGNKIDLNNKKVSKEDAKELETKFGVNVFEVSAKSGENVEEAIMKLVSKIIEKNSDILDNKNSNSKKPEDDKLVIPLINNTTKIKNKENSKNNSCCYMCG